MTIPPCRKGGNASRLETVADLVSGVWIGGARKAECSCGVLLAISLVSEEQEVAVFRDREDMVGESMLGRRIVGSDTAEKVAHTLETVADLVPGIIPLSDEAIGSAGILLAHACVVEVKQVTIFRYRKELPVADADDVAEVHEAVADLVPLVGSLEAQRATGVFLPIPGVPKEKEVSVLRNTEDRHRWM